MSPASLDRAPDERVAVLASLPFWLLHLAPLGALWTGARPRDWILCFVLYCARMFFITAGYHRYFAHRAYELGRGMQLLMAVGGSTAMQKGVLWWAGHHRHHHRHSDDALDIHSPRRGFFWSHVGWFLCKKYDATPTDRIKDFAKFPELRWLDRYHFAASGGLALACWAWGGWSALLIGFALSTVLLYHGTFTINSLSHVWGRRRYATRDDSRNNFWLALLTLGEGWHNNHHYYQSTANQGFFWWEIDPSFYVLRLLARCGLARGLRTPPAHVLAANRLDGTPELPLAERVLGIAGAQISEAQPNTR